MIVTALAWTPTHSIMVINTSLSEQEKIRFATLVCAPHYAEGLESHRPPYSLSRASQ